MSRHSLQVSTQLNDEDGNDQCLMMLPNTIYHKIDENSPFYTQKPRDVLESKFELVVILEGIVESTGNTAQTRTSYLPREILWGYRFENMVTLKFRHMFFQFQNVFMKQVINIFPATEIRRLNFQVRYAENPGTYLIDCSHMNAVVEDKNTPFQSMEEIVRDMKS